MQHESQESEVDVCPSCLPVGGPRGHHDLARQNLEADEETTEAARIHLRGVMTSDRCLGLHGGCMHLGVRATARIRVLSEILGVRAWVESRGGWAKVAVLDT